MKNLKKVLVTVMCVGMISSTFAQKPNLFGTSEKENLYASSAVMKKSKASLYGIKKVEDDGGSDNSSTGVYVGFRFMPTFTSLDYAETGNGVVATEAVLGYGIGGVLGVALSNHVGLQGEFIYSSLAQQYKIADQVSKIKLQYINIPLLLSLNTGYDQPVNLNFVVGPQIGLNVGSEFSSSANGQGNDTVNARLAVKKGDLGIAYGAGLDFGLGESASISVGFRGVFGIVDISDKSNNVTTNDYYVLDRAHIKTYAGYIGLTFGF